MSGTLNTLRELKHSFEALYEVQKYKEAFTLLLALHDLIALEIPASVLEMQEYEEAIKIFMGEFLEDTADLMLDYESEENAISEWE